MGTTMLEYTTAIESAQATSAELELPTHDPDMHVGPSLTLGHDDSKQHAYSITNGPGVALGPPDAPGGGLRSTLTNSHTRSSSRFRSFHLGAGPTTATAALPTASGGTAPMDPGDSGGGALGLGEDDRFGGADDEDCVDVDFVMHAGFPDLPREVPLTFTLTMYACLSRVPDERPTFEQILTLFDDLGKELSSGKYINSLGEPEVRALLACMYRLLVVALPIVRVFCGCKLSRTGPPQNFQQNYVILHIAYES